MIQHEATATATFETTTSAFGLAYLVKDYAAYNLWANTQLVNWLRSKPESAVTTKVASSFAGIRRTIMHMWATEQFWLNVVNGLPAEAQVNQEEEMDVNTMFEGFLKQSQELLDFVSTLTETDLETACYLDTPWVKGYRPYFEFIHHVMNHSTYHRGQLTSMGHHVGLHDAPMTDYNMYNFVVKDTGKF